MTQPDPPSPPPADVLERGLGRRDFMRAVATVTAAGALVSAGAGPAAAAPARGSARTRLPGQVLQPGVGPIDGQHYLPSRVDEVRWGYLPQVDDEPVLRMGSGQTVTIDAMSHEGLLEDQGRDPVEYLSSTWLRGTPLLRRGAG